MRKVIPDTQMAWGLPDSGVPKPFEHPQAGLRRVRHLRAAGPVDRRHGGFLAHTAVA